MRLTTAAPRSYRTCVRRSEPWSANAVPGGRSGADWRHPAGATAASSPCSPRCETPRPSSAAGRRYRPGLGTSPTGWRAGGRRARQLAAIEIRTTTALAARPTSAPRGAARSPLAALPDRPSADPAASQYCCRRTDEDARPSMEIQPLAEALRARKAVRSPTSTMKIHPHPRGASPVSDRRVDAGTWAPENTCSKQSRR